MLKVKLSVKFLFSSCVQNHKCFAYQYSKENTKCATIERNSLTGKTFMSNDTDIYVRGTKINSDIAPHFFQPPQFRIEVFLKKI